MKRSKKLTVSREHARVALEGYLKALSMINDDDRVVDFSGPGSEITVIIEKE